MENTNQNPQQLVQPVQNYYYTPVPPAPPFPTGKRELIFGSLTAIFCLLLCNFTLFGGFNLGFALATVACMGCTVGYLYTSGHRLNGQFQIGTIHTFMIDKTIVCHVHNLRCS